MTYKEYYECGERMLLSLEELLDELKDGGYACPDWLMAWKPEDEE